MSKSNNKVEKGFGIYAGTKIPLILKKGIENAIQRGIYINHSDFIRDAIKEKLLREDLLQPTATLIKMKE
jgi:Arc/MetJ-type ribon-helix-helix transcriptional regulator